MTDEKWLELATIKTLLRLIDHHLPLVVWTTNTQLHLTSIHGSGIRDLPLDPGPFIGQPVQVYFARAAWQQPTAQPAGSAELEAHRHALSGGVASTRYTIGEQHFASQIEPLYALDGSIIGCLGALIPLTAPTTLLHELQAGRDRLQTLATQLLHTQEAERRAIARELHDEIGQELTIIQMSLQDLVGAESELLPGQVAESIASVERVLEQVRNMALDLRPSQLDDLGLAESLRWYIERQAARGRLQISFDLPILMPRPPAEVETTCFRIAQEAMTNILRSAHATHVWITIGLDADELKLTIRDDGCGFDVAAARERAIHGTSLGLLSMEERATLIGGRATIESTPGQGTTVRAWLPLTVQHTITAG
jgi:signal transduction histidine kinase